MGGGLWLSGLGEIGFWSAELPAYDRARAALGEPVAEIVRAPALPHWLRTRAFASLGGEVGLRLPGALAAVVLATCTTWLSLQTRLPRWTALLSGAFVLAWPGVIASARTSVGNSIPEAFAVVSVAGLIAAAQPTRSKFIRLGGLVLGVASWGAAVASSGLVLGGAVALVAVAIWDATKERRLERSSTLSPSPSSPASAAPPTSSIERVRAVITWVGIAIVILIAARLAQQQGDGYIPLLGAAKDLDLLDQPHRRAPTQAIEELGHALFPWAALVAVGATLGRAPRWVTAWLVVGVIAALPWTMTYGAQVAPVTAPAAIVAAAGISALFDGGRPAIQRRALVLVIIGGAWVQAKDVERFPSRVASPHTRVVREKNFPADEVGAVQSLERIARYAWWAVLAGFLVSRRSTDLGRPWWPTRVPRPPWLDDPEAKWPALTVLRDHAPPAMVAGALLWQAVAGRHLMDSVSDQLSPRRVFDQHARWAAEKQVPAQLGLHRVRDPAADRYAPTTDNRVALRTRSSAADWLARPRESVAIVRSADFPGLVQMSRQHGWTLHVLDWAHHDLKIVANFVPEGLRDLAPLGDVLFSEGDAPVLENPTLVRFDQSVEVIGWQIDGDLARGSSIVVSVALRVVGRLSASSKIYVRLQQGQISKINPFARPLTGGLYPPAQWRPGDVLIHRETIEIPWVNVLPGAHELFVGLERGKNKNAKITVPEAREGAFGVRLRGRKGRDYANLATVNVR
jgi:hypothetical protein